jgi:hypothetical protein
MSTFTPTPTGRVRTPFPRRAAARHQPPLPVGRSPLRRPADVGRPAAWGLLTAVVAAAVAIRLAVPRGLWLDEAISLHQAHLGLPTLLQDLTQTDRHPPLFALALWATVHLGATSDLTVRLPSIIAGSLLVPALFALGRELYDRRTGLVAAALGAVSPLLVWYSQEARMYEFVALFGVLTTLGCARAIRRGGAGDWALYAVSASLLIWSHWFAALLVLCTQLVFATHAVRERPGRRFAIGWAVTALALAWQLVPLGAMALHEMQATGTGGGYAGAGGGGTGVSFYTVTANLTWVLGGFQPPHVTELLSAVWPLGMLAALLVLGRRMQRSTAFLVGCTLGPPVALLAWGLVNPSIFEVRYFIVAVPLAVLLLARLVTVSPSRSVRVATGLGVLALLTGALADQQLNPANPRRYDEREAIAAARRAMGPHDVLLYEPAELGSVLERYAPDLEARPLDGTLPTRREARHVVVLASFLDQTRYRRVVDRQIGALRYARHQEPIRNRAGVRLWRFS